MELLKRVRDALLTVTKDVHHLKRLAAKKDTSYGRKESKEIRYMLTINTK